MEKYTAPQISPKSYGVAVTLSMIFGVFGIHHFYLGNWLHGLLDFSLLVVAVICLSIGDSAVFLLGSLLLLIDVLHTIVVTYRLFIGKCKDGQGRLVAFPGQVR